MPVLRYAVEEAVASLWRGRRSALLAVGTSAVALFVLGSFLLITRNLQDVADEWRQAAELSVFLVDEVTDEQRRAVEALLAPGAVVASHQFVSKAEAQTRFGEMFRDLGAAAAVLDSNPLPASYEVRLQATAPGGAIDALAARLRTVAGVSDVRYDRQWLERLVDAITLVRRVGFMLGLVLTMAAALTVANVIRLALFARREEIAIMQLVGAPGAYVRGPFVVEGLLQGGLGSMVAIAALWIGFRAIQESYLTPLAVALNVPGIEFLPVSSCVYLMLGGMFVGCLGGILATRSERVTER